jgi:hypothetical protein
MPSAASSAAIIRASRKPGYREAGPDGFKVDSISDLVREAVSLGLRVNAREPELMADLCAETFADELKAALASGYRNPAALKLLKKIAADSKPKPEPDFG